MREKSRSAFAAAQAVIPGGVNSPARAFGAVGGNPLFISHGTGSHIFDVDGREFIDFVCSWGPLIFGHAHPRVIEILKRACERGTSFGAPTETETDLAQQIIQMVPSIEMVRMVNSGTEATMSAIRLARGFTGRSKVLKFEGSWHGHGDSFLIKAGSSALTLGVPDSPGIPEGVAAETITVPFNDDAAVEAAAKENPGQIAAIIVEPIAGNMGTIPPADGFLRRLREICDQNDIILVFDEVISGFRVARGGAQERYGVYPDITCLGKIVGGGLPVGAYGGKQEIMSNVSPMGKKITQAGTLSGNPLAMEAGLCQLQMLNEEGVYKRLEDLSTALEKGFRENLRKLNLTYSLNRVGAMMCLFFTDSPVTNYGEAATSNLQLFQKYFWQCLDRGIYLAPSQFECMFPSVVHTDDDIDRACRANYEALEAIR